MHNVGDVTLKRGIVDSSSLNQWIDAARTNAPSAKRNVSVTQRDESQSTVATWKLVNALPKSFNGPTLGRSTGDIALEELVLSAERIELVTPTPVHSR
jgi:phage tail-like protein